MNELGSNKVARGALTIAVIALLVSLWTLLGGQSRLPSDQKTPPSGHVVNSISTIRVGVVPAPPVSLFDAATGRATGHSIDLLDAIARRSGVKIEYGAADWSTMGAVLASGKADVIVGPVFMTEQRARDFVFADPIYSFAVVAVVPRANPRVSQLSDLSRPGIRVAVGKGGFDAEFVARNMPQAKVSAFPPDDPNLSMLEVKAGRADVAFVDFSNAKKFVALNSELVVRDDIVVSRQYAGFMLRPSDDLLRSFINLSMRNIGLSGEGTAIDAKYSESRIWLERTK